MQEYILYVDDTGFNAKDKNSLILQDEQVTFAGVLIGKDRVSSLEKIMTQLGELLKGRYGTTEFHFTEIYNRKNNFKNIQFEETLNMLDMFTDLFNHFDLRIFVHTCMQNVSEAQSFMNDSIDEVAPFLHLKKGAKTQALLLSYLKAKKYLADNLRNAKITNIICDEGLRKNGASEIIKPDEVKLEFKSSTECNLLQLADFSAWFITRAKNVLDKASLKKDLSQEDRAVLSIYSKLTNNYLGLSTTNVVLNDWSHFDYDQSYIDSLQENE